MGDESKAVRTVETGEHKDRILIMTNIPTQVRTAIDVTRSGRRYVINVRQPVGSYTPAARTLQF